MLDPMRSHGKHSTPNRESEAVAAPPGSEEVKAFFDSLAHSYRDVYCETSVYGYVLRHRRDIVTSLLPRIPDGALLDVGCGAGSYVETALKAGFSYAGVDVSAGMIRACMDKFADLPEARFAIGRAEALPFADGHFDVALCLGLLEYVEASRHDAVLSEVMRVVRPGGHIIISFSNRLSPYRRWIAFRNAHRGSLESGFSEFSMAESKAWLTKHELSVITAQSIAVNVFPPPLARRMQRLVVRTMVWLEPFAAGPLANLGMNFVIACRKPGI